MKNTTTILVVTLMLIGCGAKDDPGVEENPCDDYVDAICECNNAACEDITTQFENADVDQKDQCAASLDAAKAGDDPRCEQKVDTGG